MGTVFSLFALFGAGLGILAGTLLLVACFMASPLLTILGAVGLPLLFWWMAGWEPLLSRRKEPERTFTSTKTLPLVDVHSQQYRDELARQRAAKLPSALE